MTYSSAGEFDCLARQARCAHWARSARCDVRRGAAVFVGSDETAVSRISAGLRFVRRLRLQIGGANIAGADRAFEPADFVPQLAAGAGARCARANLLVSLGDERRVPSLLLSTAGARSGFDLKHRDHHPGVHAHRPDVGRTRVPD